MHFIIANKILSSQRGCLLSWLSLDLEEFKATSNQYLLDGDIKNYAILL